ncbi:MAG: CocE/NonD family hydrolase [Gammaproteobacteria bacterium]
MTSVTMNRLAKRFGFFLVLALLQSWAVAQDLEFRAPASAADASVPAVMRDLAGRILPVYQENDPERYLSNLSALQMVGGDYQSAYATRQTLRDRRRSADAGKPIGRAVVYDIYAHARAIEAQSKVPFPQAFAQAFREAVPKLSDRDAFGLTDWFAVPLPVLQDGLQKALDQRRNKTAVSQGEALDLIWAYFAFEAYRSFGAIARPLNAEDDRRRYATDDSILVKTPDGATLSVLLVRPKTNAKPLPALLEFTLSEAQNFAHEAAAHGDVGVVAYARGIHGSPDKMAPFQNDGADARAIIEWIAKQPWSNGRVGMYGDGYSGFAAWSAAKSMPPALKAIATTDATAPGIDIPMVGNIFRNASYRWAFDFTETKGPDDRIFTDDAKWHAYEQAWYASGRRYREFAGLSGPHSELFRRWLNHPSYDKYWQKLVPFAEQFAHINIPVLTTTGYYADGAVGALYYYSQHYRYNPRADHTLLIGPYDEGVMQRGVLPVVQGYQVDGAALVDLRDLRYQWFDHVLKDGKNPALLSERVNYQAAGSNEWRHAPSVDALGKNVTKLYLQPAASDDDRNLLTQAKSAESKFLPQTFDLADRSDAGWTPSSTFVSKALQPHNGEMFVSEPLTQPLEIGGLLTGRLDFSVNKMDVDLRVALYELLPGGDYLKLFDPSFEFRASYAHDRSQRRLLKAGVRQQITFKSERFASRRLQAGSRIVLVLGIDKRPDQQINYGTGDDVSEESIDDANVPLRIRWYSDSFIDLPTRK